MHIFAGRYKNRSIASPKGLKTRPTSGRLRETLFNICQHEIENAIFLDLFAGSGAMGLEALSRGATNATFVDNSREAIRSIQTNIEAFGIKGGVHTIYGDVFATLKNLAKQNKSFDIIYADPPYETFTEDTSQLSYSTQVLLLCDQLLDAGLNILSPQGSLFVEDAAKALPKNTLESTAPKHLSLRSSRSMGRSALQHWIRLP